MLLKQWDKSREIERDEIYRDLSVKRKLGLLSYLAVKKFEQEQYVLFEQTEIEIYIAEFLKIEQEDSQVVLKAMESQHGLLIERSHEIWSFSHLTFQEYFATLFYTSNYTDIKDYKKLAKKIITNKKWLQIFLLIGEIIDYEDLLVLMKEEADAIIISNNELQSFLSLLNKKSILIKIPYIKKSAIRAFYLDCLFLTNKNSLDGGISLSISPNSEREMERIIKFNHGFKYIYERINDLNSEIIYNYLDNKSVINYLENTRFNHFAICINDALIYSIQNAYNDEMKKDLQYIKELLPQNQPYPYMNEKIIQFKYWWKDNRLTFFNKIELVVKKHGDIDDFKFNDNQERNLLKSYYDANKLLILTYLNSGCIVSDSVRQEIEETLLLPIAEIEKRKREIAE